MSIVIVSPSRIARDRAALDGLGGDVADHHPAGRAGEAAVGDQRDLLAEALADDRRGHLRASRACRGRRPGPRCGSRRRRRARSRSALTAAKQSSSDSKTRAGPVWPVRSVPASLTTAPSGARLPRRIARPPCRLERVVERAARPPGPAASLAASASSPIVRPLTVISSRCSRPASSSRLSEQRHAAGLVEVGGDEAAAGLEVGEQRRALGDPLEVVDVELDAGLVGDGEQVQDAVGRAARRADHRDRVLDRVAW